MSKVKLNRKMATTLAAASWAVMAATCLVQPAAAAMGEKVPVFEVDPSWPQMPNGWVTGHVPSVATDRHGNIWIETRPHTVPADQASHAAPAVMEFNPQGKLLQSWGGPGQGYDWPDSEHTVYVDYKDNVWITGSSPVSASPTKNTDDMVLKFTNKGKFLLQIGGRNMSNGNADTKSVHQATDVFVDPKTNEAFVSDGYGNRRVIVFDADTGAFKRMWGAFGNVPADPGPIKNGQPVVGPAAAGEFAANAPRTTADLTGPGPQQFASPVHSVQISNDRLVYVTDRTNRRFQVFTPDGKYVTEQFLNRIDGLGNTAAGTAFSPDKAQKYLYVSDYGNSRIAVFDRKTLTLLYQFGSRGAAPGQFQGLHHIAVDLKGNIYAGEVAPGARLQKFVFKGFSDTIPANATTVSAAH